MLIQGPHESGGTLEPARDKAGESSMAEKKAASTGGIDLAVDKNEAAAEVLRTKKALKAAIDGLSGENRRTRQYCASVISIASETDIDRFQPYAPELIDALHRPEAQTRWEILRVLTRLICIDARAIDKALAGAEASLYDEDSGVARLEAFRLMCAYGATTETRSEKVWPFIDEALQCYHGDPEFDAMLAATLEFTKGSASKEVRKAIAARMKFDAENAKGPLKVRSQQILTEARKRRS